MNLNNLKPAKGATHSEKRIGRGQGSGHGGTSTRGHNGAKSRSGYSQKRGFEGGQMPLHRRLPKFGFTNVNKIEFKAINLSSIQMLAEKANLSKIGMAELKGAGLISGNDVVKILATGTISAKVEISAHAFSKSAIEAITNAGGSVVVL